MVSSTYYRRARFAIAARTGQKEEDLPEEIGTQSQVIRIAQGLIWVARHYCHVAPDVLQTLIDEASRYRPRSQPDLHPKVRERLDQLYQPVTFGRLLHLPRRLERIAYELIETDPIEAARLARASTFIETEMYCPLRLDNARQLQLHENILFSNDDRNRVVALRIPFEAYKGRRLYTWPVDHKLATKYEAYLHDFHPIQAPSGSRWLYRCADSRASQFREMR